MASTKSRVSKKFLRAIMKYELIEEGDRVLIGISGGKDSMTMAYLLSHIKPEAFPKGFEWHGIHVNTDFAEQTGKDTMFATLDSWGVPYTVLNVPVMERLKEGETLGCYWCSSQRRQELLTYADTHGYNKIALGHHLDDILETFFMNMVYKSELATMVPKMEYEKFGQTIIRPLALVLEEELREFVTELGIGSSVCTCDFNMNSHRRDMREVVEFIAQGDYRIKERMYQALSNPVAAHLVPKGKKG